MGLNLTVDGGHDKNSGTMALRIYITGFNTKQEVGTHGRLLLEVIKLAHAEMGIMTKEGPSSTLPKNT